VVKELDYAIKGRLSANQARGRRREGKFGSGRGSGCPGVAIEHNLLNDIGDIKVCTEAFETDQTTSIKKCSRRSSAVYKINST
jgi:hypothetical protein